MQPPVYYSTNYSQAEEADNGPAYDADQEAIHASTPETARAIEASISFIRVENAYRHIAVLFKCILHSCIAAVGLYVLFNCVAEEPSEMQKQLA